MKIRKCILAYSMVLVLGILALWGNNVNAEDYSKYSNETHGWGLSVNKEHKVPINAGSELFEGNQALYYVETDQKEIYLTFDCGFENGFTPKILDTLKKHNVKALFFVTKPYLQDNADLVKRMKEEGHLVGNHTCRHLSTPSLSEAEIKKELNENAEYMKEKTGYDMDLYFRPPMGEFSERTLHITKDMGYTTVLWSMAFYDYDVNNQPGADAIYKQFMTYYHKGAIPLVHVISQSDTEALDSIISSMQEKGYSFASFAATSVGEETQHVRITPGNLHLSRGPVSVSAKSVEIGDTADITVLYYDLQHKAIKGSPKKGGIYYVKAYAKGDATYHGAASDWLRIKVKR